MIVYFSGTGNSVFVARQLASLMRERKVVALHGSSLSQTKMSVDSAENIIWVFPVYSWGVPPVVGKFVANLVLDGDLTAIIHHAVITCGDDIGRADRQWRKMLEKKGWTSGCVATVQMPNIYVLMKGFDIDSEKIEKHKIETATTRVEEVARLIKSGVRATDVLRGKFGWFKTSVIYPWFVRYAMSPKPFHATTNCISCGKCASGCPLQNIKMAASEGTRPIWSDNCALCLRCYHFCPVDAVQYGKATRNKGHYRLFSNTEF